MALRPDPFSSHLRAGIDFEHRAAGVSRRSPLMLSRCRDLQLDFVDLPAGRTDVSFTMTLRHEGGTHSRISASKLNRLNVRELRAYGDGGSYVASGTDVQAQAIFAGKRPVDDLEGWGFDSEEFWERSGPRPAKSACRRSRGGITTTTRPSRGLCARGLRHLSRRRRLCARSPCLMLRGQARQRDEGSS
jgi:hypothetical protein